MFNYAARLNVCGARNFNPWRTAPVPDFRSLRILFRSNSFRSLSFFLCLLSPPLSSPRDLQDYPINFECGPASGVSGGGSRGRYSLFCRWHIRQTQKVVPDASKTGQDLSKRRDDQIFSVTAKKEREKVSACAVEAGAGGSVAPALTSRSASDPARTYPRN